MSSRHVASAAALTAAFLATSATGTALASKTEWSIDAATPTLYISQEGCWAELTTTYTYASAGKLLVEGFVNGTSQGVQTFSFNGKGTATSTSSRITGGSSVTFTVTLVKQGASAVVEATTTTRPSSCPAVPSG
jgi:hypothetical protein